MKLEFLGHDERYIVEQSLMTLFPLEKPTYDAVQPEDEAWCRLAAEETAADCQVTAELHYHGYTAAGTFASPLTGTDFEKEGQRRYAVAACFYLAFLDLYPKLPEALRAAEKLTLPPWGMLTGVRPDKPITRALMEGKTNRVVVSDNNIVTDIDIEEGLAQSKDLNQCLFEAQQTVAI